MLRLNESEYNRYVSSRYIFLSHLVLLVAPLAAGFLLLLFQLILSPLLSSSFDFFGSDFIVLSLSWFFCIITFMALMLATWLPVFKSKDALPEGLWKKYRPMALSALYYSVVCTGLSLLLEGPYADIALGLGLVFCLPACGVLLGLYAIGGLGVLSFFPLFQLCLLGVVMLIGTITGAVYKVPSPQRKQECIATAIVVIVAAGLSIWYWVTWYASHTPVPYY